MLTALIILCIFLLSVLVNIHQREKVIAKRLAQYTNPLDSIDSIDSSQGEHSQLFRATSGFVHQVFSALVMRWQLLSSRAQYRVLMASAVISVLNFIMIYLWGNSVLFALCSSLISAFVVFMVGARWLINQRLHLFEQHLPQAIGTLSRCLSAGVSLPSAIRQIEQRSSGLIEHVFGKLSRQLAIGVGLDDALLLASNELKHYDFSLFTVTLRLNQRAGGQLVGILNQLAKDMTTRQMLNKKLRAQTAGVRSSAKIIAAMVPALLGIFYISAPHILDYFKDNSDGKVVGAYAFFSIVVGLFIVRKMTRLEQ